MRDTNSINGWPPKARGTDDVSPSRPRSGGSHPYRAYLIYPEISPATNRHRRKTMVNKQFITAGNAIFTVQSKTGQYYTYRITKKEANGNYKEAHFASVLTGPDNTSDYTYLGLLNTEAGKVTLTKSSKYDQEATLYKVLNWALHHIWADKPLPEGYQIRHEGRCGRCGHPLTTPTSLDTGLGPECIKKVG